MSYCSYELASGIARQLGVGVERDDEFDGRQNGGVADNLRKTSFRLATQQSVQLSQFAPLAFIPHPETFELVPAARPVEQIKDVGPVGLVFDDQEFDACPHALNQRFIFRPAFLRSVREIGQQSEMKIPVA